MVLYFIKFIIFLIILVIFCWCIVVRFKYDIKICIFLRFFELIMYKIIKINFFSFMIFECFCVCYIVYYWVLFISFLNKFIVFFFMRVL